MFHPLETLLKSVILVYDMSTLWEYTDGCAKQCMCDLTIYLMTVLSSSYGIIMDRTIHTPGNRENIIDRINATDGLYLKAKM